MGSRSISDCESKLSAEEIGRAFRTCQLQEDRTAIGLDIELESKKTAALSLKIDDAGNVREHTRRSFETKAQTVPGRLHLGAPRPQRGKDFAPLVKLGRGE